MSYIYELPDWPAFFWDENKLLMLLAQVRYQQGRLLGHMETLGFSRCLDANLENLTLDVVKSSDIEGEVLDRDQVRSSIARRLGMDIAGLVPTDKDVEGVVEMMLDATQKFNEPMSKERLFAWHASLFPTGRSGMTKITVGKWRGEESGEMQVVSGPYGREWVHFEAPAAKRLEGEMAAFIAWFNGKEKIDPVLKAGIAHIWFVTIHPFEDGNGRITRALSDMLLARSEESQHRFYSMSAQIRQERKGYYDVLEKSQKSSNLDITPWLEWFLNCLNRALDHAEAAIKGVFDRVRFWDAHAKTTLNDRQRLMINKLLDRFEGKLTSSKWAKITKSSQDTAIRDITDLVARGILVKDEPGGRSTSYSLKAF